MKSHKIQILSALLVTTISTSAWAEPGQAGDLPHYQPAILEQGSLTSVGSDSMDELVGKWVEAYKLFQPTVSIQVQSRGSATAPAALIEGVADLGPMARPMKTPELESFKQKYGFAPTQIRTAVAGTAVYVSPENPLTQISLDDLDAIYSAERKRGTKSAAITWGDLNAKGGFGDLPIMALGTVPGDVTHTYFRQRVLLQSPFAESVISTADTRSMFATIVANKNAIGFGEAGFANGQVKALAIKEEPKGTAYLPTKENLLNSRYPLGRYLNVYIVRHRGEELDATTKDFLRFVLSVEGQQVVESQGLMPLPASVVKEELKKLM